MATAVASGMPKLRIEESAAKRQARIDSGQGLFDIYCVLIQNFFYFILFFFDGGRGQEVFLTSFCIPWATVRGTALFIQY